MPVPIHRNLAARPEFEFWNHGYDHHLNFPDSTGHVVSEFKGTGYEVQLRHLQLTQDLARENCGIVLHAFGAPGIAFDSNTVRALDACEEITVWLIGGSGSHKFVLPHTINIEDPIFEPNVQAFEAAYDPAPKAVVYQIHPKDWSQERFDAFRTIVDFLVAKEVTFTTPSAYARIAGMLSESSSNVTRPAE